MLDVMINIDSKIEQRDFKKNNQKSLFRLLTLIIVLLVVGSVLLYCKIEKYSDIQKNLNMLTNTPILGYDLQIF